MNDITNFIETQLDVYKKNTDIEITLGLNKNSCIFDNLKIDESKINNIIKNFRNYKLSYSQGKIYKNDNYVIKTFNNKNNEISENIVLENEIFKFGDLDLLVKNINITKFNNIHNSTQYNEEIIYDELCVHLNDYTKLYFQNLNDTYNIKYHIYLEKNICLKIKNEILELLNNSIIILQNNL